ncbi:hypothetical protein TRFO_17592 [Tritrichomonas foetus]|uniref:Uncharacterized protein n=1 Tax=Tritrichomonas foetus TaxID=1144522 RepID=A0A1J4KSA3_9EUKA|nr:hypothetical protein TRFO_17592 [Tritrichomonas foetus]|eukprot:OHT12542.1 hypothetical protein TRFO_17592 [Tritrichomonas foetus]
MFLCLVFAVYSADVHQPPKYTTVSVANAYEFMYSTNNWTDTITAEQYSKVPNSYFILRQPGDLDDGFGADGFFEITGTPQEIAEFRANAAVMTQVTNKTFQQLKSEGSSVYVVELKKSATYAQAATFWVTIVFFIIFIGGVASGLLIWHYDRYDLDPANSLLFVTEGNLIVSGANDPK